MQLPHQMSRQLQNLVCPSGRCQGPRGAAVRPADGWPQSQLRSHLFECVTERGTCDKTALGADIEFHTCSLVTHNSHKPLRAVGPNTEEFEAGIV